MRQYLEYLKLPYKHLESDCYSLVRLFYKNEFGIELPILDYPEDWPEQGLNLISESFSGAGFYKKKDFSYGNLIVFGNTESTHLGISLGDGTFLHTTKNGTARQSYREGFWSTHIMYTLAHSGVKSAD